MTDSLHVNVFAQGVADLNNIDFEYQHFLLANIGSDPLKSPHTSQFT